MPHKLKPRGQTQNKTQTKDPEPPKTKTTRHRSRYLKGDHTHRVVLIAEVPMHANSVPVFFTGSLYRYETLANICSRCCVSITGNRSLFPHQPSRSSTPIYHGSVCRRGRLFRVRSAPDDLVVGSPRSSTTLSKIFLDAAMTSSSTNQPISFGRTSILLARSKLPKSKLESSSA